MIRHLLIVATGFRLAGILLGVASIAALVHVADTWFLMRRMPPPKAGPPLDIKPMGWSACSATPGYGLHALGGLVSIILVMVAITAALGLLVALLLSLTGSGIGHHATWARIVAILIASSLTVASCAIMVAIRCDHAAFAALPIGLSAYTLRVLIWRFA